jgi:FtsP/CotA-like multicopper oxidase with cupredoxin domain
LGLCVSFCLSPLDDVVELVIIDEGHAWDANHPMHLHGHGFRVIAMDKLNTSTWTDVVEKMDRQGEINRNLHKAPIKDTVTVPDGG